MVSFIMRKIFYSTAMGAEQILNEKRKEFSKLNEIQIQINLCKKIMDSIQQKEILEPASLIRAESKLRRLEHKLNEQKYRLGLTSS